MEKRLTLSLVGVLFCVLLTDSAVAGESLCSFGWLTRQPALAAATALLHSVFIDSSAIPMAEAKQSA